MSFTAAKSACGYLWLFAALLQFGWGQDIVFPGQKYEYTTSPTKFFGILAIGSTTKRSTSPMMPWHQVPRRVEKLNCSAPPQPVNGEWRRHPDLCTKNNVDCKIPEGTKLESSIRLVYTCETGYMVDRNDVVFCRSNGDWSGIPRCIGCGRFSTNRRTPNATRGIPTHISQLPSHASLYKRNIFRMITTMDFLCSATIIHVKFLLTAANCIYDERTKAVNEPGRLFVMAGNKFREYDHPGHDPKLIAKAAVKNVYIPCTYYGRQGNYAADIALLELREPFEFSDILQPICLDVMGITENYFEPGVNGKIAGIKKPITHPQSTAVPYVPFRKCKSPSISSDKFCTSSLNDSTICDDESGGGLAFQHDDSWYILGIISEGLDIDVAVLADRVGVFPGQKTCTRSPYTLYTSVSEYISWIGDVISHVGRDKAYPSCDDISSAIDNGTRTMKPTTTATPNIPKMSENVSVPNRIKSPCLVPPQPKNGEWKLSEYDCIGHRNCKIPQGSLLKPGSRLVYSCGPGYILNGSESILCGTDADWCPQDIPVCIEIRCYPLTSTSTNSSCTHSGKLVSCSSPMLPGTSAKVSCEIGYKRDTQLTHSETVSCDATGTWRPDPIKCIPECGIIPSPQKTFVTGGYSANITEVPWHASLYRQTTRRSIAKKEFRCGATIIHTNFVLTAAHCVFDERTETLEDPKNFFVMAGNFFCEYDSPLHNFKVVQNRTVRYMFVHSEYHGLRGNYVSDIALLELQEPLHFSSIILPACLDVIGRGEQILEAGAIGKVAGFGRTDSRQTSDVLMALSVPYIPYSRCRKSANNSESKYLISYDKFCAGHTNGSAVCDGDSGGGLVFPVRDQWYVMGIVSTGLAVDWASPERMCDRYSYTLYTKVPTYVDWIQRRVSNPDSFTDILRSTEVTLGRNVTADLLSKI